MRPFEETSMTAICNILGVEIEIPLSVLYVHYPQLASDGIGPEESASIGISSIFQKTDSKYIDVTDLYKEAFDVIEEEILTIIDRGTR
ncbi:MAG: hypothetical protein GXP14_08515 [Gammaproteobacteria bacterium]|nr:hypothetical protein [Gammaproteobacteria bacterium]